MIDRICVVGRTIADIIVAFGRELAAIVLVAVIGLAGLGVVSAVGQPSPAADSPTPPSVTLTPPGPVPTPDTTATVPPATDPNEPTPGEIPDSVSFMATHPDGTPLRIDPCGTIEVVYDLANEPYSTAIDDVRQVAAMVAFAMGHPIDVVAAATPGGVDISFGWVPSASDLSEDTDVLGEGGPVHDGDEIVAGSVLLVAHPASPMVPGLGPDSYGTTMLHELMHAVNVGHSTDPGDVMYPVQLTDVTATFGPGDGAALQAVGGACVPSV